MPYIRGYDAPPSYVQSSCKPIAHRCGTPAPLPENSCQQYGNAAPANNNPLLKLILHLLRQLLGKTHSQPSPSRPYPPSVPRPAPLDPGQVTTLAYPENGSGDYPLPPNDVTTLAIGEEGGGGNATTIAYPEGGSGDWNPGEVTTLAEGEEGGGW